MALYAPIRAWIRRDIRVTRFTLGRVTVEQSAQVQAGLAAVVRETLIAVFPSRLSPTTWSRARKAGMVRRRSIFTLSLATLVGTAAPASAGLTLPEICQLKGPIEMTSTVMELLTCASRKLDLLSLATRDQALRGEIPSLATKHFASRHRRAMAPPG
jgi:hypothetical protein